MINLSVNINKIASLRNTRDINVPNLVDFVDIVINSGCQGITIHPRIDERHIRFSDISIVKERISDRIELNIECDPDEFFIDLVLKNKPTQCTLVPTKKNEITSSDGFDLTERFDEITKKINRLKNAGIRTSIFSRTDLHQVRLAKETGVDSVEFYTGEYAMSSGQIQQEHYNKLFKAAELAHELGLRVHCGHDLTLINLKKLTELPGLVEVSIGHHLITQTLYEGIQGVIHKHLELLQ